MADTDGEQPEKQCRICYDGVEAEADLGRLIKPCLCRGSISYVHVKCLDKWRNTRTNRLNPGLDPRFFQCGQCHYKYRYKRTTVSGLATNPVVVGAVSTVLFTSLVLVSSFVTTFLSSAVTDEPTDTYYSNFYYSPYEVVADLIRASIRIIKDEAGVSILDESAIFSGRNTGGTVQSPKQPSLVLRFIRRFILGLPVVAAGSLVQLLTMPLMGPLHWLARYRTNRRRENSRDMAALVIVMLLAVGAARALYKVYKLTESIAMRLLSRVEDSILEVN